MIGRLWPTGGGGFWSRESRDSKTCRDRDGLGLFPPQDQLNVMVIATSEPADYDNPATRWSLDDIAATILKEADYEAMSRSTIWRILEEADLKPHKSVYWLNSHDPDFESIAREIGALYVQAPAFGSGIL